jgi:protein TonB
MKRILPAIILALLIHWGFFEVNPFWLKAKPVISRKKPGSVTVSISYRKPEKKEVKKKVIKKPEPVKPMPEKKKVKKKVKKQKKILKVQKEPVPKEPDPKEPEKTQVVEEVENEIMFTEDQVETAEEVATSLPAQARKAVPLYRYNPPPHYPKTAKRRGYQGTVILEILVTIEGKVADIKILESSGHKILDKAAKKSAEKWSFEPGYEGNKKVEMWVEVPVTFTLKTQ